MAKKKITTKKKESTIEKNKARNAMMLNDAELSDVPVELCYNLFLLRQTERGNSKGVDFVSLKESIDTSTPQGKFMLTVFGAMAELERESILERQKEGIAIAKEAGLYKGKQKMKIDRERFEAVVREWRADTITAVEAMKKLDLKPNTFYRRVKEWGL